MKRNEFDLLYSIYKYGLLPYRELASKTDISLGSVSKLINNFLSLNYINDKGITSTGIKALEPYKVNNAVILAAGTASRFVPLSIDRPKGLLEVKGEILIERQISQLLEAGIKNIIIVLGYKKEMFYYLANKYPVTFVINPTFDTKNNIYSLYHAREYLTNSYICSSDDYFAINVFEKYVYQSYYSSIHISRKSNEWYMLGDKKGNISKILFNEESGDIMLGHVYFDSSFSTSLLRMINEHVTIGDYDNKLWEYLLKDNLKKLPPMEIKKYSDNIIYEFDSLEDLKSFDESYINDTHSNIAKNIALYLNINEEDISSYKYIETTPEGVSFSFVVDNKEYIYHHYYDENKSFLITRKE